MVNKLKHYFPTLKSKNEIKSLINQNPNLKSIFYRWSLSSQEEFLDFCSGSKGIKILYDSFFKEIFNPEYYPNRLNKLLSVIMKRNVRIIQVLPVDSVRMADETSLVTMDIVVELEDGSIINVEVQKIGYMFPGERCACYSSDLVLRQYKRIKNISSNFSYKAINPVYTIVFFENSPQNFKKFTNTYIHNFEQRSNTGLELELLQRYIFVSLDIFKKVRHNIENELDAWLTFLSSDNPDDIIFLIKNYPEFKPIYETLFNQCQNIEGVMNMFSKELYELDRNTAKLMVDEFSQTIEKQNILLAEKDNALIEKDNALIEKDIIIARLKEQLNSQR